jgi:hypothetical protein
MIFSQDLLVAAYFFWRNVIPKGTMKNRFEPRLPRIMKKYKTSHPGFVLGTPASVEYILPLDHHS